MILLSKSAEARARQTSVLVHGAEYKIRAEFWRWINYGHLREQEEQPPPERFNDFYAGSPPGDMRAGIAELDKFWLDRQLLPDLGRREKSDVVTWDWDVDGEYVCAKFIEVYGIDLETENDMHWHRFLGLWRAILIDINEIMSARQHRSDDERGDGDTYDRAMERQRDAWWLDGTKPAKRAPKRKR